MLPKLLAGVLLIVVLAAVSTVGAVYFLDYSGPTAEPPSAPQITPPADAPPCCDVSLRRAAGK